MISPELLRRFPFFGRFNDKELRAIAMVTDEIKVSAGATIFEEKKPASGLYLLINGGIDLSYKSEEDYHPKNRKVFPVGEVNPGEIFGISALIEPWIYSATAVASLESSLLLMDSKALRAICEADCQFGYLFMYQMAKTAMERLAYTRIQLAAAWA